MKKLSHLKNAGVFKVALVGLILTCAGCGDDGVSAPVEVQQTVSPMKPTLETIAETGVVGSSAMELEQAASSNPELKAEVDELIKADGNAAEVKKKAAALLKKL